MKPEYIIALIPALATIIVAIINGIFRLLENQNGPKLGQEEKTGLTNPKDNKRSKWIWIIIGVGFILSLGLWFFRDSIADLYSEKYEKHIEKTIKISAKEDWQNSFINLSEGTRFEVIARNEKWSTNEGSSVWVDADGTGQKSYFSDVGISASMGSLIAKIGDNPPFFVGKSAQFVAENSGPLYFRTHDSNLDDNMGTITIRVIVWR